VYGGQKAHPQTLYEGWETLQNQVYVRRKVTINIGWISDASPYIPLEL